MTATASKTGLGIIFAIGNGDGPPETFTSIAEVSDISACGQKRDVVEATHLNSPSNTKEFIAGLVESDDVSLTLNYLIKDASQVKLRTALLAGVTNFKITWNDVAATVVTFAGIVQEIPAVKAQKAAVQSTTVKLKVTGPVTFT
jgi:hypothetical protein